MQRVSKRYSCNRLRVYKFLLTHGRSKVANMITHQGDNLRGRQRCMISCPPFQDRMAVINYKRSSRILNFDIYSKGNSSDDDGGFLRSRLIGDDAGDGKPRHNGGQKVGLALIISPVAFLDYAYQSLTAYHIQRLDRPITFRSPPLIMTRMY